MTLPEDRSIEQLIAYGTKICSAVSDSAKLDSQLLLCKAIAKERSYLLTWPEKLLPENDAMHFFQLLERRVKGEPVAYILGEKEFWSLPFEVNSSTLIPRPDTEVLVEIVLNTFPSQNVKCLDLGTGTGAIAIAIASERPKWELEAVDYCEQAVALATRNAQRLAVSNVAIYQSNWFDAVDVNSRFDIIVSNPPYIDELDPHLKEGDVRFEPKSALVAANAGLADIEHIAENAWRYLNDDGALLVEHGFEQGQSVRGVFEHLGYSDVVTIEDYNGQPRITMGYKKAR